MKLLALLGAAFSVINADVYIQAFRGGNNRLDEANRNRNNGNRLFDSQNNNRGGYNVGKLSVYPGEHVPISWTNQHGSGTYQLKGAEIVIQYMCDELARDGTSTGTIPINNYDCFNFDCDTDVEYGRHESYWYYHQCRAHERNKGLFTANQNMNGRNDATRTRQNPNGNRRGYECPEERDYYPYWRPSPWRDIVVYTNQVQRCSAYKRESQNSKAKYECRYTDEYWTDVLKGYASTRADLPMNHTECDMGMEVEYKNVTYNKYYLHKEKSHGIADPDCQASVTTRANHHGTFGGRELWTHIWQVPDLSNDEHYRKRDYSQCCVVRVRYNITTDDYMAWESDSSINAGLDYMNNTKVNNPNANDDPAWVKIWERFGLTYQDVHQSFTGDADDDEHYRSRGYVFRNNPHVDPFGYLWNGTDQAYRLQLELAINTNQFGRTFQDRTHCFSIKDKLSNLDGNEIKLLSVQGKRGNIVQVYPATEYFFIPEPMVVGKNDYVHFCWTGSNTNPNNNDGQGKAGADRSNICPLTEPQYDKSDYNDIDGNVANANAGAIGDLGCNYPNFVDEPSYSDVLPDLDMLWYPHYRKYLGEGSRMGGFSQDLLNDLCTQRRTDENDLFDYGNMEELDDAGTTYCIKPVKPTENGMWNFLCTRNNNFSNRSQKGSFVVGNMDAFATFSVGTTGGQYSSGSGGAILIINNGMVQDGATLNVEMTTWTEPGSDSSVVQLTGSSGADFDESVLVDGGWFELWIPYTPASLSTPEAFRRSDETKPWKSKGEASIDRKYGTSYAVINVSKGGFYKVNNVAHVGYIIAMVVIGSALVAIAGWTFVKKCKN